MILKMIQLIFKIKFKNRQGKIIKIIKMIKLLKRKVN